MEDKGRVRKGYHCAWQIHNHIVFPVKYRKVLLDKGIIEILKEIAIGIQERYELEIEAMGMDMDIYIFYAQDIRSYHRDRS